MNEGIALSVGVLRRPNGICHLLAALVVVFVGTKPTMSEPYQGLLACLTTYPRVSIDDEPNCETKVTKAATTVGCVSWPPDESLMGRDSTLRCFEDHSRNDVRWFEERFVMPAQIRGHDWLYRVSGTLMKEGVIFDCTVQSYWNGRNKRNIIAQGRVMCNFYK